MDNCYKCQFRNNCIPVRLYQEDTVYSCKNYAYDNEFYDNMPEDFKIHTLKLEIADPLQISLLVYNEDRSIFEVMRFTPELVDIMDNCEEIYVKGYVDSSKCLQLLRQVEPQHKW